MYYVITKKNISTIKRGDLIIHNGTLSTVCDCDIKRNELMGLSLFGDCYNLGTKPVIKAIIKGAGG